MPVVKNPSANAGDLRDKGLTPESGRSYGGGHGNPLQYSCLENLMDREVWWATVHRVAQSWTQLKWLNTQATTWDTTHTLILSTTHPFETLQKKAGKTVFALILFSPGCLTWDLSLLPRDGAQFWNLLCSAFAGQRNQPPLYFSSVALSSRFCSSIGEQTAKILEALLAAGSCPGGLHLFASFCVASEVFRSEE